jgi:molecular chaperone GrpE
MKHKKTDEPKRVFEALSDALSNQDEQLFGELFLTESYKQLMNTLPAEHREAVRNALMSKGVFFKTLFSELLQLDTSRSDLQKERDELFGKLQRLSADYMNFQKRVPKQIADTTAYEKEKIMKTLLPPLDNLERTLQNAGSTENANALTDGIRIIYDQLIGILGSQGVEQIKAVGEKFDPALHEAMIQKSEPDKEDNVVLEELQKGYKINGRAIRPSRVVVNKLPPKQETQQTEKTQ